MLYAIVTLKSTAHMELKSLNIRPSFTLPFKILVFIVYHRIVLRGI